MKYENHIETFYRENLFMIKIDENFREDLLTHIANFFLHAIGFRWKFPN